MTTRHSAAEWAVWCAGGCLACLAWLAHLPLLPSVAKAFQIVPDALTGPVQQGPLVVVAEAQFLADVGCRQPADVAQRDHARLAPGQGRDGGPYRCHDLVKDDSLGYLVAHPGRGTAYR